MGANEISLGTVSTSRPAQDLICRRSSPTRLMDATGEVIQRTGKPGQAIEAFFFPLFNSPEERSDCRRDAARRDEVRLISLSLSCLLRRILPGFHRETRRFILPGENSRQVSHELSRFPLLVNQRAPATGDQGAGGMPLTALLPGKRGRSGADKRQQIGVDGGIGVGGVHPVREAGG